ncbi:MAG: prephenate dehydrogenase/arogenate dehydrogenase family protein [Deltaproteobacteria bacterium]
MRGTRLGIAGLGLIGGSLALALRRGPGSPEIWGYDRRAETVRLALAGGAIDRGCSERDLAACDIVMVCVPVIRSLSLIRRLGARMRPGTLLTDAGSVKDRIVREGMAGMAAGAEFLGGHPIAGTENSGFTAADPDLFRGRTAILTPVEGNSEEAVRRVEALWIRAGSRVVRMDPKVHDHVFAWVSHLPHAVAYALVHSVSTLDSKVPLGYSAGGFRDFTRIASSNPEMWKDIVLQNRTEVLRAAAQYRRSFGELTRMIREGDEAGLIAYFRKAKTTRDRM